MTSENPDWKVVAEKRDRVGEGPVWVPQECALYWVDVLGPAINRLSLQNGAIQRWEMPEPIGFIVPRNSAPGFVAGFQSGFYFMQLDPFSRQLILNPEPHLPNNRLNDGKADADGRLFAGTMPMNGDAPSGTLYRMDPDLSLQAIDDHYHVSNGPAFSPAHNRLYHADSPKRVIYRFTVDDAGELHDKSPFIQFADEWGYPDGMTVDSEGFLWVAHWDGGRVSRFDPEGELVQTCTLPASRITSCAFGGSALDRLFVTSACEGVEHERYAGALFEITPPVPGLCSGRFNG